MLTCLPALTNYLLSNVLVEQPGLHFQLPYLGEQMGIVCSQASVLHANYRQAPRSASDQGNHNLHIILGSLPYNRGCFYCDLN